MIVLGDHHAVVDMPEGVKCGPGHLPGGLSDGHKKCAAGAGVVVLQRALDCSVGEHRSDGGADDLIRIPAQLHVHERVSRGLFTTLMGAPST